MATITAVVTTTAGQDNGLSYRFASKVKEQNGGTGYAVGNILTLVGGTFSSVMTLRVTGVTAVGRVTSVDVATSGSYTVFPSSPAATTGGSGSGCTLALPFATTDLLCADILLEDIKQTRIAWKDAQRAAIASAVENATNAQLTNAASALGIVLP